MSRTRMAIVGLGMAVKPHAESFVDLADRVEVAYAYSPTEARRRAFAAHFDFPLCDDLDVIMADDTVAAVSILTPPNTHLDLVSACARAGKHVLLEKPLEITTARAEELVAACRDAGVRLGVVLQHRWRPAARRLADIMAEGHLGALVGASLRVRNGRAQSYYDEPGRGTRARDGGGVLLTQGIHTLDLFLALAGPVDEVFAYAATSAVHRMETEDIVAACLRFEGGAMGTIEATTTAFPGFPETIELIFEHGTASILGTALVVRTHDGTEETVGADAVSGGTGADPMAFPNDDHRALIADFLDAIVEDREPRVSGAEALRVHDLIDALLTSASEQRPVRPRLR